MSKHSIETALLALSARDQDYASEHNNVGFNSRDTNFGNSLANAVVNGKELTYNQRIAAYKMLRTYKNQLLKYDIDYDQIEVPSASSTVTGGGVAYEGDFLVVTFPYDKEVVAEFKTKIPGKKWDPDKKRWLVNLDSIMPVLWFADKHKLELSAEVKKAIKHAGIKLEEPENVESSWKLVVNEDGTMAEVIFGDFPGYEVLNDLKKIPGRKYDPVTRIWSVPVGPASIDDVKKFADFYNFKIDGNERITAAKKKMNANIIDSRATDADIDIPGFGSKDLQLLPFQRGGVKYALNNISEGKGIYIADEMGLGKSPQSLAVLQKLDAYPALIVVPKVVWLNWAKEAKKWVPKRKVVLLTGKSLTKSTTEVVNSLGARVVKLGQKIPKADIYVVNYDILDKWAVSKGKRVGKGAVYTATGPLSKIKFKGIIFDEAHLLKGHKTKRNHASRAIVKDIPYIMTLSGTPSPNRPSELTSVIKNILNRLDEVGGWQKLWFYHCEGDTYGARDLDGLNAKMRASFYVRRTKADVLPELPPVRWVPVSVEMSNPKRYWDIHEDISNWIRERVSKDKKFLESIEGLKEYEQQIEITEEIMERTDKASGIAETLVKMGALRQVASLEKMDATIEWIQDFLANTDEKILVFGIHREANERLAAEFNAPIIYGGMKTTDRFDAETKFQEDPECRVLVCSIAAAGVGLTLTAATSVVFTEIPWRPMDLDQAVARAYGRLSDLHGVTAYTITTPGTIEDTIVNLIEEKREITGLVADGVSIIDKIIDSLVKL